MLLFDARAGDFVGPLPRRDSDSHDPFPIRRVLATQETIAAVINRSKDGEWHRLPRDEFEKLTRAATRKGQASAAPQLIEANYRAKLVADIQEGSALQGTAEWKIANGGLRPGILPLQSLGIAVTSARWANNRNAVLGLIEPRSPPGLALLVEESGDPSLALDWSSRGVQTPGDLRFDLAVPACPIAVLELEIPTHFIPVTPQEEALVDGPFPHGLDMTRQNWRIAFGNLSHLEIVLRPASVDSTRTRLFTNATARFDLSPESAIGSFTIEYQAAHSEVLTLLLEHDEDLTITDVNVLNLESWRSLPGAAEGRKNLEIRLREPARGGQLRIATRSSVPLNEPRVWTAPAIQLVGAVTRSESLHVRIPPELRAIDWRAGGFRLMRVEHAGGTSTVVFEPALVPEGLSALVRPSVRLQLAGTEYRVRQQLNWTIATSHSSLTSRVDLDVQSGAVHQLLFRLPIEAQVEKVDLEPRELISTWTIQPGVNPLLQIDLARPIAAGSEGRVSVDLRLPGAGTNLEPMVLLIPDFVPLGAKQRTGDYEIRVDPAFEAFAPSSNSETDLVGPTKPETDNNVSKWSYRFHKQPPTGPLRLLARPIRLNASIEHAVIVEGPKLRMTARLRLQPEAGIVSSVLLYTSEAVSKPWSWRTVAGDNHVVSVEPMPIGRIAAIAAAIGSGRDLDALCRLMPAERGQWWRLTLARPVTSPVVLESHYESASDEPNENELYSVPLLNCFGAIQLQRTLTVRFPSSVHPRLKLTGMSREGERREPFTTEATYRFTGGVAFFAIAPNGDKADLAPFQVDSAKLVSVVEPSPGYRCWYSFRFRGAALAVLPIGLVAGSEVLAVAVAGRPLGPEQVHVDVSRSATTCSFAVPGSDQWHTVEILYKSPAPKWRLTTDLYAPIPQLPATPTCMRVEWRLPPEVTPINPTNWTQLVGGSARISRLTSYSPNALFDHMAPTFNERADGGRISLNAKSAAPKTVEHALMTPGGAIERPVVDTFALDEAGVRASTPAPIGGWNTLGLVVIGFPGGTVLTTPRQLSIWRANSTLGGVEPSIQKALENALRFGRDSSGRFRTVADWAESDPESAKALLLTRLGGDEPGWTAWESRDAGPARLVVVQKRDVSIVGWIVAALLAAIGILLVGRLGKTGVILLVCWLLLAGIALQWLPVSLSGLAVGPMLAGLLVAVISVCRRRPRRIADATTAVIPGSTRGRIPRSALVGTTTALLLALTGNAAAPEEVTVYLVAGSADEPEPRTVFAPAELITRLKRLADPKPAVTEHAFLRAAWSGRVAGNSAEFEAQLIVYCFVDRTRVELPLGETRLRSVLLDGAVAYPKTAGIGRASLEIEGRGEHRIDLKSTVAITGTGPEREIRFGVPEAPITNLDFQIPSGFDQPQVLNWQAAQRLSADGRQLRADLGRARSIHLRWQQAGASAKAQVRVQEAAVWDLSRAASTLYAAFDYRFAQGSLQTLKIALPPDVEISKLEIRPGSMSGSFAPSLIRDWSVGADRVLSIELQTALSGAFQLILEAVSYRLPSSRPGLQFPGAVGISERETYLAYRLRGLELSAESERRGMTDFSIDSFLRDIWRPANVEQSPAAPTRAFRRSKNESAFVRPVLAQAPAITQATQELDWHLSQRGVDLRGVSRWSAANDPLSFVEWETPAAIVIHDIRGTNIHSWFRIGSRVQVWLRDPAQEVMLVWNGSLPRTGPITEAIVYDLPVVRLEGARSASTLMRVSAPIGWALSAENVAHGIPIATGVDREVAYLVPRASAAGRFVLRGLQAGAHFQSVTTAEVADRRILLRTGIETNLRRDRSHSLVLTAGESSDWTIDVSGPEHGSVVLNSTRGSSRDWVVEIPSRDEQRAPIIVTMSRPLLSREEVSLPPISILQGDQTIPMDRWFAFLGPEIRPHPGPDLRRALDKPESILVHYPNDLSLWHERGGALWKAGSSDTTVQVVAAPNPLGDTPVVRIGLIDIEAVRMGALWIYRASVDLVHERTATLDCVLPSGASLAGLTLDGTELSISTSDGRMTIPLPYAGAARLLQMVWTLPAPVWTAPAFSSSGKPLQSATVLWTAMSGPGERIEAGPTDSIATQNLKRAEALLKITADPDSSTWPDECVQRLARRAFRRASLADVASAPRSETNSSEHGPAGVSLDEWAKRLREQAQALGINRAGGANIPIREYAFDKLPFANLFQTGTPVRWSTTSQSNAREVRIQSASSWTPAPALASFGMIAIAVIVLGALMLLLSRQTRPEQVAVIGLIAMIAFGSAEGVLFLGLIALAMFIRVAWVGTRVYRWLGG